MWPMWQVTYIIYIWVHIISSTHTHSYTLYLFVCLPVGLSISVSVCLSVCLPAWLSLSLSLSVCLCLCLSVCFFSLSLSLSLSLSHTHTHTHTRQLARQSIRWLTQCLLVTDEELWNGRWIGHGHIIRSVELGLQFLLLVGQSVVRCVPLRCLAQGTPHQHNCGQRR